MYKTLNWNSFKPLHETINYQPSDFNLKQFDNFGVGVKVAVIDSGVPNHEDIKNIKESINFSKRSESLDELGHATAVCGVLAGNGDGFSGIAFDAELYLVKACDIELRFDACIAGIIWSIIKKVDIILMPFSCNFDHETFRDVIKKAQDAGIVVIAASDNDNVFPSSYKEVISIGDENSNQADFIIPSKDLVSTFVDQKYAKVNGSSISCALFAGAMARLISEYKIKGKGINPKELLKDILP